MGFFSEFVVGQGAVGTDRALERIERATTTHAAASDQEIIRLERQVERLTLASQAMWEILRATGAVNDEHLLAKMQEIDLRDGKEDGKISPSRIECPQCQRISASRHRSCMYCGTELPKEHVFEG